MAAKGNDVVLNLLLHADRRSADEAMSVLKKSAEKSEKIFSKALDLTPNNTAEANFIAQQQRNLHKLEAVEQKKQEFLISPYRIAEEQLKHYANKADEFAKKAALGDKYAPARQQSAEASMKYYTTLLEEMEPLYYTKAHKLRKGNQGLSVEQIARKNEITDELVNTESFRIIEAEYARLADRAEQAAPKIKAMADAEWDAERRADFLKDLGESAEVADEHIVSLVKELEELTARQQDLKDAGVGTLGYKEWEQNERRIASINAELNQHRKDLFATPVADDGMTAMIADAKIADQEIVNLVKELDALVARQKELESAGIGLGYEEWEENARRQAEIRQRLKEREKSLLPTTDKTSSADTSATNDEQSSATSSLNAMVANATKAGQAMTKVSDTLKLFATATGETSGAVMSASSAFAAAAPVVSVFSFAIQGAGKVVQVMLNTLKQVASALVSAFSTALRVVKSIQSALYNFNKTVVSGTVNAVKKLSNVFKSGGASSDSFRGKLKQSLQMMTKTLFGFRSFFYLYRRLRSQVVEGFNELVKASPELNTAMSETMTLLYQLRVSFASAITPVITAVLPVLNSLISTLNSACNALANFFAVLTGKGTFLTATVQTQDYAKSLDKTSKSAGNTAKQLDKFTAGIDELNVIDADSSGGSGSSNVIDSTSIENASSKLADLLRNGWLSGDLFDFGKELGDRLAEALASIDWDLVKAKAHRFGANFASCINGLLHGSFDGKTVATWLGETFAEGLNTLMVGLTSFFEQLDSKALAQAILDFFDGAIDKFDWAQFKTTLDTFATRFIQFFEQLFTSPETFANLGESIGKFFNNIMQSLIKVIKEFPYAEAGIAIGTGLKTMFESGITGQQLGEAIATLLNGAMTTGIGIFKTILQSDTNIGTKFSEAVNTISDNFNVEDFKTLCSNIGTLFHNILVDGIGGIDVASLMSMLGGVISGIWEGVKSYIRGTPEMITHGALEGNDTSTVVTLGDTFVSVLKEAIDYINTHWSEIDKTMQDVASTLGSEMAKIFDPETEMWDGLGTTAANAFNSVIGGIVTWLKEDNNLENFTTSVKNFIKSALNGIDGEKLKELVDELIKIVDSLTTDEEFLNSINTAISKIPWASIAELAFKLFWAELKLKIATIPQLILGALGGATYTGVNMAADAGADALETIGDGVKNVFGVDTTDAADTTVKSYSTSLTQSRYKSMLGDAAKTIGSNVVSGINDGLDEGKDESVSKFTTFGEDVVAGVASGAGCASPSVITFATGTNILLGLINGMNELRQTAVETAYTIANAIVTKMSTGSAEQPVLSSAHFMYIARQCIMGFTTGLTDYKELALTAITTWAKAILTKLTVGTFDMPVLNVARFKHIAQECVTGFVEGVTENTDRATASVETLGKAIATKFTAPGGAYGGTSDEEGSFFHYGVLVIQGFINGLESKRQALIDKVNELGDLVSDTFHDSSIDLGSPSRLFRKFGSWTIDGFIEGVDDKLGSVTDIMNKVADRVTLPGIVTGQSIPSGLTYSADRLSSNINSSANSITDNSFLGNSDVVAAIQTLTQVVQGLNLNVRLDSKQLETGIRAVQQRRGASIATGGVINYA